MAKTVAFETLTPEIQSFLEEIFAHGEPVTISKEGEELGLMSPCPDEWTEEEEAYLLTEIKKSEQALAEGRYTTLEAMNQKRLSRRGAA